MPRNHPAFPHNQQDHCPQRGKGKTTLPGRIILLLITSHKVPAKNFHFVNGDGPIIAGLKKPLPGTAGTCRRGITAKDAIRLVSYEVQAAGNWERAVKSLLNWQHPPGIFRRFINRESRWHPPVTHGDGIS